MSDIDDVLRERGAIIDAHEYLRRRSDQQRGRQLDDELRKLNAD
jgi:hypothetical protein